MVQRILVCDEETHIVRAISLKFTRAGFDVSGASNIDGCWKLFQRFETASMLIIDYGLLTSDEGMELIRRVHQELGLARLPVIALADKAVDQNAQQQLLSLLSVGRVFSKPFSPRELLASVTGLLEREPTDARLGPHLTTSMRVV